MSNLQNQTLTSSESQDDTYHPESNPFTRGHAASAPEPAVERVISGAGDAAAASRAAPHGRTRATASAPHIHRMSSNPAHEATDSLQSTSSSLSLAHEAPLSGSREFAAMASRQDTQDAHAGHDQDRAQRRETMDFHLPEDDGMFSLRQKLQEIRQLAVSTEEKAMRMHELMIHDYKAHRATLGMGQDATAPIQPVSSALPMPIDPNNSYNLRPGDLDPSFSTLPRNVQETDGDGDEMMVDDSPELGCMHYKRNVKIQCFDCHRWFPCRHCHDQAADLPFVHNLNRKKTQSMLCMLCQTPQPAAETCTNCGQYAAWYYCSKCKLWDNDISKRIYHCDDCGICRVGEGLGKDYVHCRRCNVCISISTSASHPCIEGATEGNCPLCLVPLFESRTAVVSLPCGHYMHGECYKDLMAVTYKCPVCSKSAVNMELQWRKLDDEIRAQPMPDEDEDLDGLLPHMDGHMRDGDVDNTQDPGATRPRRPRLVWIGCNDCGGRSWSPFHWLGFKCQKCDSYNTNQLAPTVGNETESERLIRQQQVHHQFELTGDAVLRDAGIGIEESQNEANQVIEVPNSPSQQPVLSTSPGHAHGAHSPGRYFVRPQEPRRSSFSNFSTSRFSAPSMPNLPNLPNLSEMPRMPRIPNLPNLDNMRQNLPQMPNIEFPRFSPYDVIDALGRGLSPMRQYFPSRDGADDRPPPPVRARTGSPATKARPWSIQSDPAAGFGCRLQPTSSGSVVDAEPSLWDSEEEGTGHGDSEHEAGAREDVSSAEEEEEDDDAEMGGADGIRFEDLDIIGHR